MKIVDIDRITNRKVVCGNAAEDKETVHAFPSDLLSDVLTINKLYQLKGNWI